MSQKQPLTIVEEKNFPADDSSPCKPCAGQEIRKGLDRDLDGTLMDAEVDEIILTCEKGESFSTAEEYRVETTTVDEPKPGIGCQGFTSSTEFKLTFLTMQACSYGVGQNLTAMADLVRAMKENRKTISIPDSHICEITIEIDDSRFAYDDQFFLLVNERVIHSSSDHWNSAFITRDGLRIFDFGAIRNLPGPMEASQSQPYCIAGASKCEVSAPEYGGVWKFVLPSGAWSLEQYDWNAINLSLVVLGDNESTDCSHSQFEVRAQVTYY